MCPGIPLSRRESIPLRSPGKILGHSPSMVVHEGKFELGFGDTLFGQRFEFPQRRLVVASLVSSPPILEVCPGWSHEPKSDDENYERLLHIAECITICAQSSPCMLASSPSACHRSDGCGR